MRKAVLKTAALAAAALAVLAVVAGCTSSSKKSNSTPASKSGSAAPTHTLHQGTLPATIPNQPELRANVKTTKCAAIQGGWGAEGTVTNTAKNELTYHILVYFTTTSATTLDYAQADVKVAPGKTVDWKAEKQFPAEPQMLCPIPGISAS